MVTLQLNQPLQCRTVSQSLGPSVHNKRISEGAQGKGDGGMQGETVEKIISIEEKRD